MVQEIELSKLMLHPKNVRKNYSDIDELADSIKAKGILQNLTVVRNPDMPGTYLVVIGNRRLAAARKAGLKTAPCTIAEMDEREQAETMLLENMERNDLSIYEQGQGFQMCLDLGETEADLAEKTGFSKKTIRHRLNIAKLNQDALQEAEHNESFQLTLKDLYELEKIDDIDDRNRILGQASDSNDITIRVKMYLQRKTVEERKSKVIEMLTDMGVKKAPETAADEIYTAKWKDVAWIRLNEEVPESIDLKGETPEKCRWLVYYSNSIRIITRPEKKEPSEYELDQKERKKRRNEIHEIARDMFLEREQFIQVARENRLYPKSLNMGEFRSKLLWLIIRKGGYIDENDLYRVIYKSDKYSLSKDGKLEEIRKKESEVQIEYHMLLFANEFIGKEDPCDYEAEYRKESGELLMEIEDLFKELGFSYSNPEYWKISDGTHELYMQKGTKADDD